MDWLQIVGATGVLSAVAAVLIDRSIGWRRSRLGPEGIATARKALYESRMIFNQSVAGGGYLTQPWRVDGVDVPTAKLEDDLNHAMSTVSDKRFAACIDEVLHQLHLVWVENHPSPPLYAILGQPLPAYYQEWQEQAAKGAERQLIAARAGIEAEKRATQRLRKLSKYS